MAMETLSDFIARRLGELDSQEQHLRRALSALKDEQDQLHRAAQAAGVPAVPYRSPAVITGAQITAGAIDANKIVSGLILSSNPLRHPRFAGGGEAFEPTTQRVSRSPKRASEKTIKEAVVEILQWEDDGMPAVDILAKLHERFGFDYPRTSLSPQLSRLKAEGMLVREGMNWRLADTSAETNEAADDPSAAPISQPVGPFAGDPLADPSEPGREVEHDNIS